MGTICYIIAASCKARANERQPYEKDLIDLGYMYAMVAGLRMAPGDLAALNKATLCLEKFHLAND